MGVYSLSGDVLHRVYAKSGSQLAHAYDKDGEQIFPEYDDIYGNYTFVTAWNKGNSLPAQGFDIKDDKVFWAAKAQDANIPTPCYVFNLSDGSQALSSEYITIYSGHGNNISFSPVGNKVIATPAYPPSRVFVNEFNLSYIMSLSQRLTLNDGSTDCDACYDPNDSNIMYSLGHTAGSSDLTAPFLISKWKLNELTDNGDGTFTPRWLSSVQVAQPESSYYFQGCKFHNNLLWFCSGVGTANGYVYGYSAITGERMVTINLNTTREPEGLAFYPDAQSKGGYCLYVGFHGMLMRRYTFI